MLLFLQKTAYASFLLKFNLCILSCYFCQSIRAIALAKSQRPNLILMDIQMPRLDGLEAIRQIRLDPNLVHIPIVALTALAMSGDRKRCLEAGANEYLSKPVKLKELSLAIEKLLL
jgi:CheY-like chemotaxis protein